MKMKKTPVLKLDLFKLILKEKNMHAIVTFPNFQQMSIFFPIEKAQAPDIKT